MRPIIKYGLPLLFKAPGFKTPGRRPAKRFAGLALAYCAILIGAILILIAGFIWLLKAYGSDIALLAIGLLLIIGATLFIWVSKPREVTEPLPLAVQADPLAAYIPDSLRDDPAVQKLLRQINDNPVAATTSALALGLVLARNL